mmetsp:Transcript_79307/g.232970  ORF Transcript_79307/g.232970 Transcript_79307/m.232970 type:complete len:205 (+) Transcript_79307:65-679(+)
MAAARMHVREQGPHQAESGRRVTFQDHAQSRRGTTSKPPYPEETMLEYTYEEASSKWGSAFNNQTSPKKQRRERGRKGYAGNDHFTATTMIFRNIPCRITLEQFVEVVNSLGFRDKYDLVHILVGKRSMNKQTPNLGYGFINFFDPADAWAFGEAFNGYQFEDTNSTKKGQAQPANVQGFLNSLHLIRRSQSNKLMRGALYVCF